MIYYIYWKQWYKSLLPLNEKCIFENVLLVVVKIKSGTMKVVNMKFSQSDSLQFRKTKTDFVANQDLNKRVFL